jgi:hypothetical protein
MEETTLTTPVVESPPIAPDYLRPGALAKLHDPNPAWASGLSDDFRAGHYGRNWREVVG